MLKKADYCICVHSIRIFQIFVQIPQVNHFCSYFQWALFITCSHLLLLFLFHTHLIYFHNLYCLQMALGSRHFLYFCISRFCRKAIELIKGCNQCTIHCTVLLYLNFVCNVMQRVGFMLTFICMEPALTHTNNQGVTKLNGSIIFYIKCQLALLLSPSKV